MLPTTAATFPIWDEAYIPAAKNETNPTTIFMSGPAREMIPFSFTETFFPKIYTAPGAAKINPPNMANASATINPRFHARYSALAPKCIATYLWASSCIKNPVPTASAAMASALPKLVTFNPPSENTNANAAEREIQLMSKSVSSWFWMLIHV